MKGWVILIVQIVLYQLQMPIKEDVSEKIICFDNIGKTGDILDFQATQLSM